MLPDIPELVVTDFFWTLSAVKSLITRHVSIELGEVGGGGGYIFIVKLNPETGRVLVRCKEKLQCWC